MISTLVSAVPDKSRRSGAWFITVISVWFAAALFSASAWLAFAGFAEVRANITVDEQIRTTELAAVTLLCVLSDAETGQRGYLLTGDPVYLTPYETARRGLGATLSALGQTPLMKTERPALARLRGLIRDKMAELARTIALARAGQREAAIELLRSDRGRLLMDGIRREIAGLRTASELRMVRQRQRNHLRTALITVTGLAALVTLLGGAMLARRVARRSAAASEAARHTFASAFDLAQGMVRSPDGLITFWSHGAGQLYGFTAAEALGRCSHELLRTEFPAPLAVIEAELRRKGSWQGELVHYRRDGTALAVASHWSLHRGHARQGEAVIEVNNDITPRRRDEQRLRLLVHELNHRVKNTLSTVQALAMQSLGQSDPRGRDALESRLLALASAHDVLTEACWEGGGLDAIAARVLAPFGGDGARFRIMGPPLQLRPQAALALAMALNELATNAVKYGAISPGADGWVSIRWWIEDQHLHLVWTERNGPPVAPPARRGFGSVLIERGLPRDLGGRVSLEFPPQGLTCTIEAALAVIAAGAASLPEVGAWENEVA